MGMLGLFKYTNLILDSVERFLGVTGLQVELGPLPLILPLGISFYTYQTMSYTIDVFRGRLAPRDSLLDVAVFDALRRRSREHRSGETAPHCRGGGGLA